MRLLCVPAGRGGAGRGPGPGRLLAAVPGEGPGWRPHLAGVSVAAAAGAWSRPGGVGGPGGYAPPPSERPGVAARDRSSHARPEENRAKVCPGGPAPTACLCPVWVAAGTTQTSKLGQGESDSQT